MTGPTGNDFIQHNPVNHCQGRRSQSDASRRSSYYHRNNPAQARGSDCDNQDGKGNEDQDNNHFACIANHAGGAPGSSVGASARAKENNCITTMQIDSAAGRAPGSLVREQADVSDVHMADQDIELGENNNEMGRVNDNVQMAQLFNLPREH